LFPNARKNWRKIFVKVEKVWNEKTLKIWEAYLGNNWLKCFPIIIVTKRRNCLSTTIAFLAGAIFFIKALNLFFLPKIIEGFVFSQYLNNTFNPKLCFTVQLLIFEQDINLFIAIILGLFS
jgi:hypothetical protein